MKKDKRQFTWLSDSCVPSCKGPKLTKSELHNVADYPPAVLDEWVKTGNAMYEEELEKSKKGEK